MSDDWKRKIFGSEYVDRDDQFRKLLKQIEEKHIEWFNKRKENYPKDRFNELNYHWMMYNEGNRSFFKFMDNSDLPDAIKKECIDAFEKVYSA